MNFFATMVVTANVMQVKKRMDRMKSWMIMYRMSPSQPVRLRVAAQPSDAVVLGVAEGAIARGGTSSFSSVLGVTGVGGAVGSGRADRSATLPSFFGIS